MSARAANSWQLVFADLALLLFIVALGAMVGAASREDDARSPLSRAAGSLPAPSPQNNSDARAFEIAPSQALVRLDGGADSLGQWLDQQLIDPRATLTLFIDRSPQSSAQAWRAARALDEEARKRGMRARFVIRSAGRDAIYASLGFDEPAQARGR